VKTEHDDQALASGGSQHRFDDLVRSERYFTATLLAAILLHDGLAGVDPFLRLLAIKANVDGSEQSERDRLGNRTVRRSDYPT
jgi:hypothetical protein